MQVKQKIKQAYKKVQEMKKHVNNMQEIRLKNRFKKLETGLKVLSLEPAETGSIKVKQ